MGQIALGTYSIRGPLHDIVRAAIEKGCNIFDTAPNYRHGAAQNELSRALKACPRTSVSPKIRIFSKVGFFSPKRGEELYKKSLISLKDAKEGHSFNPAYIRYQVLKNIEELEQSSIDLVFLHNPERCFREKDENEARDLIYKAFVTLEELCAQGLLKGYGIATWSGLEETEGTSKLVLSDILEMVCSVGSVHHFRAIQLPLSLVKIKPISAYFQKRGPIYTALKERVEVFGSSPLHGGLLPPVLKSAFLKQLDASLTAAEACLLFAKSVPGISAIFTSPSSVQQLHQSFDVSRLPPFSEEKMRSVVSLLTRNSWKYRDAS